MLDSVTGKLCAVLVQRLLFVVIVFKLLFSLPLLVGAQEAAGGPTP